MGRSASTLDVYHAISEPRRREIIDLLSGGDAFAVGSLVETLGLPQPAVSKHLGVLRKVGLVSVRKQGQHRMYQLEAKQLKTVHDWTKAFERFWGHQLDRIKIRAERASKLKAAAKKPFIRPEDN